MLSCDCHACSTILEEATPYCVMGRRSCHTAVLEARKSPESTCVWVLANHFTSTFTPATMSKSPHKHGTKPIRLSPSLNTWCESSSFKIRLYLRLILISDWIQIKIRNDDDSPLRSLHWRLRACPHAFCTYILIYSSSTIVRATYLTRCAPQGHHSTLFGFSYRI